MPPTLTTAIAPTFTLSTAETFTLTFSSGTSPVTVTMAAGDYRMVLGGTSGTKDYLRALSTAIQAALTARGASETCAVGFDSSTLLATIAITGSAWTAAAETAGAPLRRAGFNASVTPVGNNADGVRAVLHLACFIERVHIGWQPVSVVSGAQTLGGVPYGITSGVRRDVDQMRLGFVPSTPAYRTNLGLSQTALYPADQYAFSLGVVAAREWSVLDVLTSALGQPVAFARGTWQTLASSTTDYYDLGAITIDSIMQPSLERTRDGWDAYYSITLDVTRSSTETRA